MRQRAQKREKISYATFIGWEVQNSRTASRNRTFWGELKKYRVAKIDILESVRAILQRDIGRFPNKHPLRRYPRPQPARRSAPTLVPLSALDKSMIFAEGHSAAMPPNSHLAAHCRERGDLVDFHKTQGGGLPC